MTISPDKEKALETAMTQVERQFGKGSIMKLGSRPVVDVPVISTSSLALDKALGIGGLPRGRCIEIYGPEASGKTTLALHAPLLMRNMRWIPLMPKDSGSIATICLLLSRIPANRRLKLRICW